MSLTEDWVTWMSTSRYLSTDPASDGPNYVRTVALGKKLAEDLESNDTLGRWMAHHVAELIAQAEAVDDSGKREAQERCAREILNLWAHRREYPGSKRPFEEYESIQRALERLDPEQPQWSFFRNFGDAEPTIDAAPSNVKALLTAALELERQAAKTTRLLVHKAVSLTTRSEAAWFTAASHITDDESQFLRSLLEQFSLNPNEERDDGSPSEEDRLVSGVEAAKRAARECQAAGEFLQPKGMAQSDRTASIFPEEASIVDEGQGP